MSLYFPVYLKLQYSVYLSVCPLEKNRVELALIGGAPWDSNLLRLCMQDVKREMKVLGKRLLEISFGGIVKKLNFSSWLTLGVAVNPWAYHTRSPIKAFMLEPGNSYELEHFYHLGVFFWRRRWRVWRLWPTLCFRLDRQKCRPCKIALASSSSQMNGRKNLAPKKSVFSAGRDKHPATKNENVRVSRVSRVVVRFNCES